MRGVRVTMAKVRDFIVLARQLAPLAPNRLAVALNSIGILLVWAADRGWRLLPVHIRVSYGGQRFKVGVGNGSEIRVIREMFVEQQYAIDGLDPKVIVDLGSNVGASIAFFRATYPDAEIIGTEPAPDVFDRLRATVKTVPAVRVYPWAVAGRTGRMPFRVAAHSWASALAREADAGTIDVEAVTLGDLLARLELDRVDLLKLDVEGAEWLMFEEPSAFASCETIIGELHLDLPGQTVERAKSALAAFDVSVTARTDTRANFLARRSRRISRGEA